MAHLKEQLGDERFQALISSDNTGRVKELCDSLVKDAPPSEMTVGDRTYDMLDFLRAGEESVVGYTMVDRSKEMNANLGKEDGEHILEHQDEIPFVLRGKVVFVLPDWRHPDNSEDAYYVCWRDGRWARGLPRQRLLEWLRSFSSSQVGSYIALCPWNWNFVPWTLGNL